MKAAPALRIRSPAQAGRFYPASPVRLQSDLHAYLAAVSPPEGPAPKALIVPHAGYVYSGPVAASGFVRLGPMHEGIRRVVLVGPSHYEDFDGVVMSGMDAFATPLGQVPLDAGARTTMEALRCVRVFEPAHEPEHCLEVELPFLQTVLDDFTIVPLLTCRTSIDEVDAVLEQLWGGAETCIIISSDLSHYLDYATAARQDRTTAAAIESLCGDNLSSDCACGHRAIRGFLQVARRRGLRCETLDLRSSGDTSGARDRVVGYGAFAFH